ncbi:MAG TPA: TonB-dependent receptor [Candidatus Acidoferrum sp.]|nr:TonB-dependent receptor [Candidatus Acidoferrum sp.]
MKSLQVYLQTLQFAVRSLAASAEDMASLTGTGTQIRARHDRLIWRILVTLALFGALLAVGGRARASVTASISGTVSDTTGAVIEGATVVATNTDTGIAQTQRTNAQGYYSFQELPLGHYNIEVTQTGFKTFRQTGLVLDVNAALVADVKLQVGEVAEKVIVTAETLHVDTANTQMGELIGGHEMTQVPLVTRSYTDLLALQPGVISQASSITGAYAGPNESAGFALPQISGSLSSGALSVNGMRETANGFILNGATVQESGFGGTAVVPNLDSIAEFRILTNNFDAEYGNYAGGQINVVTKSGSNQFHGGAFEFLRNTDFDAANFFGQGERGVYHQNQFGGTIGGPIKRDKIFFFADYQGNRTVEGISSGQILVPSQPELGGNFSTLETSMTGAVQGAAFAQTLQNRLQQGGINQTVSAGEPYYTPGCTSATCVFPNGTIPSAAFDPVSKKILALNIFPAANNANGTFSTSSFPLRLTDNKASGRVDVNTTHWGMFSGYYDFDNYNRTDPYWPAPLPLLPGFGVTGTGRTNLANIGYTKTISSTAVNELRFEYVRLAPTISKPSGGTQQTLSGLGFTTGASTLGIDVLAPQFQGVPELDFVNFSVGVPSRVLKLFENTYQVLDNFSKVIGTHTVKFGGSFHYTQLTENLSNIEDGNFGFGGAETGIDFADFLIGAPSTSPTVGSPAYGQGQAPPSYGRNHYAGLYGQDSWRVRSNLTLNYGLRWEFSTPWSEKYNELETLIPGEQSIVFPGAPAGWVFPGDPGVPSTLAPTRYNNFAPRIGLAYSPSAEGGVLRTLLGGPGQSSIRVGYGIFYGTFEGATNFNEIGDAPFGNFYGSITPTPEFDAPFIDRTTGDPVPGGQKFPVPPIPHNASATNPDNSVNWSQFIPIGSSPGFYSKNRLPYAEDYEISLQRQFSAATLLTISYVGTEGHRLLSTLESNPGSPALCAALNALGATPACGPGGENTTYVLPAGAQAPSGAFTFTNSLGNESCPAGSTCVAGTRAPFNPAFFTTNGYFIAAGNSNYNSLQVNLRHTSGRAQVLVGYTYSKSLDDSSGYGEQINPVNAKLSRGLSAFDETHNFVASYNYHLPFDKLPGPNRLTNGWQLSGITRFSTGIPVTLIEGDDHSLLGTSFTGPQPLPVDTPDFSGGSLGITNPRKSASLAYFNTSLFTLSAIGQEGTASRRFFHGPGINNWDMALLKDTKLTERISLQFRAEVFNVFNHAQFQTPNGNINSSVFGLITNANDPRIGQLGLKLLF